MSYTPANIIKNSLQNNKISHAYLFHGNRNVDLDKYIFESIKLIIESNGKKISANNFEELKYFDLKIIEPTFSDIGKESQIRKEDVDFTINSLLETPLEKGAIKFLYIKNIDKGNKHSLNRLLKFIEEPVDNLIIFMSSHHFNSIIGTIKSRSQNIYVKQENLKQNILDIKNIAGDLAPILANIYPNKREVEKINLEEFKDAYEKLINAFEIGLKEKYLIKEKIYKIWNKSNSQFVLNIMQLFFYQLIVNINKNNPLFPGKNALINSYKNKKMNLYQIINSIDNVKRNISKYSIFNLQKINLLNELEELL